MNNAEDYVEAVLDRPHEHQEKQIHLDFVLSGIEMEKREEFEFADGGVGMHWPIRWV